MAGCSQDELSALSGMKLRGLAVANIGSAAIYLLHRTIEIPGILQRSQMPQGLL